MPRLLTIWKELLILKKTLWSRQGKFFFPARSLACCITKELLTLHAYFFSIFLKFYWRTADLQCCDNCCCTTKWFSYTRTHIHFLSDSFPTDYHRILGRVLCILCLFNLFTQLIFIEQPLSSKYCLDQWWRKCIHRIVWCYNPWPHMATKQFKCGQAPCCLSQ